MSHRVAGLRLRCRGASGHELSPVNSRFKPGAVRPLPPTHQSPMEGATTPTAPAHRQRLLELPAVLLSTITSLVVEFGYGNELSLTCRAFSLTNLLHAPAFRVQLVRHHCDHLLTYRVVTALQARTKQLSVVFEQPPPLDDEPFDTPTWAALPTWPSPCWTASQA
ncbi:hypothetical protein HaLaN_28314 [Haematococcus lacustris]|uniref:Uncharacterized protein n=1 Tax=Haematococcus lacustris TaxID=44745 RepID=A0A6A0AA82_HAELA|nr:hypothetical protein HaLaN_28314 [Haematococcus lacustris]